MFFTTEPKEVIAKAATKNRPRWKETRNAKRLEALNKRMSNAVKLDLFRGVIKFRSEIPDKEVIYEAWLKGDYAAIDEIMPWEKLRPALDPARQKLWDTLMGAAGLAMEVLPAPIKDVYRYDYKNPRIERVWKERTGEWMVEPLINGGRDAIQTIIHRQMTEGLTPRDMAGEIKNYIGLYPRLANAHLNYVTGLRDSGMSEEKIAPLSEKYYAKLLDYRSMMIARTETMFMINRGQLEVWRQGQDNGIIPKEAQKVWVVDGDPCEEVCAPMDGEGVGMAESWLLPNGDVVEIPTEAHPNCNCIMTIDYEPEETEKEPQTNESMQNDIDEEAENEES